MGDFFFYVVLLVLAAAGLVIFPVLALDGAWTVPWFVGVGVLGTIAACVVFRWRDRRTRAWLLGSVYASLVFLEWTVFGFVPLSYRVVLDNYSPGDLTLDLDGRRWRDLPHGTSSEVRLKRGRYEAVLRGPDGKEVDRLTLEIARHGFTSPNDSAYVFNALGAQTYALEHVVYGAGATDTGPRSKEVIDSKWFWSDADYLFEAPPPVVTVRVRKGSSPQPTTKTHLYRRD